MRCGCVLASYRNRFCRKCTTARPTNNCPTYKPQNAHNTFETATNRASNHANQNAKCVADTPRVFLGDQNVPIGQKLATMKSTNFERTTCMPHSANQIRAT